MIHRALRETSSSGRTGQALVPAATPGRAAPAFGCLRLIGHGSHEPKCPRLLRRVVTDADFPRGCYPFDPLKQPGRP